MFVLVPFIYFLYLLVLYGVVGGLEPVYNSRIGEQKRDALVNLETCRPLAGGSLKSLTHVGMIPQRSILVFWSHSLDLSNLHLQQIAKGVCQCVSAFLSVRIHAMIAQSLWTPYVHDNAIQCIYGALEERKAFVSILISNTICNMAVKFQVCILKYVFLVDILSLSAIHLTAKDMVHLIGARLCCSVGITHILAIQQMQILSIYLETKNERHEPSRTQSSSSKSDCWISHWKTTLIRVTDKATEYCNSRLTLRKVKSNFKSFQCSGRLFLSRKPDHTRSGSWQWSTISFSCTTFGFNYRLQNGWCYLFTLLCSLVFMC